MNPAINKTGLEWMSFAFLACVLCYPMNGQAPPACQTRDLIIDLESTGTGSGHDVYGFELSNQGNRICTLSGYPSAVALNNKRKIVREIHFQHLTVFPLREDQRPQEIQLKPGDHAWFQIDSSNPTGREGWDNRLCKKATNIRITPPLNKNPFSEIFRFGSCDPDVFISFLIAGTPND
jgi:hypothetical protein